MIRNKLLTVLFLILVPLLFHLSFSSLGYNPTDDGFILAQTRRILEGEVPHKDFINVRLAGSAYLHIPFVLFGGDYTYWISRLFVWFEFWVIAWVWTQSIFQTAFSEGPAARHPPDVPGETSQQEGTWLASPILSTGLGGIKLGFMNFLISLISLIFSIHWFPIMAWNTVDALFVYSVGLFIYRCYGSCRSGKYLKIFGYLLIGFSVLTRQGFIFLLPLTLILLNDWRKIKYWTAVAIPLGLYILYILINGGLRDFLIQITAQSDIVKVGWTPFFAHKTFGIYIIAGVLYRYIFTVIAGIGRRYKKALYSLSLIMTTGIFIYLLYAVRMMSHEIFHFIFLTAFDILGIVLGFTIIFLISKKYEQAKAGILASAVAWCTSLSIGYNSPALALGILAVYIIFSTQYFYTKIVPKKLHYNYIFYIFIIITAGYALYNFVNLRKNSIYREQASVNLKYDLGSVLPGGKLIKTNAQTYAFLADLKNAADKLKREQYAILPQVPGWWVRSPQRNPLPIDWVDTVELPKQELVKRVTDSLSAKRGKIIAIVQKYRADSLQWGYYKFEDYKDYKIVDYIRHNWKKTGETEFFELYK